MKMRLLRPAALAALCGMVTLATSTAQADITMERSMSVAGVGAMAFGNMSGTSKTTISGDKSRTDSDIKMQSKLVRFLAHSALGPTAEIVRLDQDKIYHLNINKKEYTETSFEQMRAQLQKASEQMNSADEKKQPAAIDESKCEWLPPKADVKKTGEKAQFAGYEAERIIITASQPCKDKETGSICEVALVLDNWFAGAFAESSEAQKYARAYAAKMGFDATTSQDIAQRAQTMFGRYKGIWSQIAAKMQGVKGYPVKTSFTLGIGGAQCKNSSAQQAQAGDNSDSSSASNPGALAGQMAGKLGSLFHRKKDDADSASAPAATPATSTVPLPAGDVAVMTISSQLISVSTNSASADAFTVPADFKRQETKTQ
jgi:hypothetical protein